MKKIITFLGAIAFLLLPFEAGATSYSAGNSLASDTDNSAIYYYQLDGNYNNYKTNIMRRMGNDQPELYYSVDGYPRDYSMNRDNSYLAMNFGDSIKYLNMKNKQMGDIYNSKNQISGMTYSPNGNDLLICDQNNRNSQYRIYSYSFKNQKLDLINQGNASSRFYPIRWREDGKIIFLEVKNGNEYVRYFDLAKKQMNQTQYMNPYWMSSDGNYMAMPSNYQTNNHSGMSHHLYDPYRYYNDGYSAPFQGSYSMINPVDNSYYGNYGNDGTYNSIMGYLPDSKTVLYQSANRDYYYNQNRTMVPNYYRTNLNSRRTVPEPTPYQAFQSNPYANTIGAEIVNYGNLWVIFVGKDRIASSQYPMGMISQGYSPHTNISRNQYQNKNHSDYPYNNIDGYIRNYGN